MLPLNCVNLKCALATRFKEDYIKTGIFYKKNMNPSISFDWAIKRLLRQKANYEILEGFLSELLKEDIV